ncbi:hypothetical protein [Dyella acidisoli]|uniref:hypothetical protein n=1 Tax=Dyella acidisoli TaxID=1867834 RepID=UPI0024E056D2|nr:hypothetical protein [Dyella acidisoli]
MPMGPRQTGVIQATLQRIGNIFSLVNCRHERPVIRIGLLDLMAMAPINPRTKHQENRQHNQNQRNGQKSPIARLFD